MGCCFAERLWRPTGTRFNLCFSAPRRASYRWVAFAVVIASALAGFAGSGSLGQAARRACGRGPPFSDRPMANRRASFFKAAARLRWLSAAFLDLYVIERVRPEPLRRCDRLGHHLAFAPGQAGEIHIEVTPRRPAFAGSAPIRVNGEELRLHPIILP